MQKYRTGLTGQNCPALFCSVSKIFIIKCNFPQHNQLWRTKYKVIVKFPAVVCRVPTTVRSLSLLSVG